MSLTQQVQQLLPLQPKLSTTEVERDTALHRLERLQVRGYAGSVFGSKAVSEGLSANHQTAFADSVLTERSSLNGVCCVCCLLPCYLQEQFDQLQRQLQHATAREAGLQVEVEAYKLEHSQLLAANTQLMGQCTELNKELQVTHGPLATAAVSRMCCTAVLY